MLVIGSSLEETLQLASTKFGEDVVELQTPLGGSIDDISLLRYIKLAVSCHQLKNV